MTPEYKRFLRLVCGVLGFGGFAALAFHTRELFHSFEFWKLVMCILMLPGAAMFLFFAFYRREHTRHIPDGGGGAVSASVPWPAPTKPPSLSAHAAAEIPEHHD
jgi:hypothetical protein